MRDAVAYLRNRAEDERRAGNNDASLDFDQCADRMDRLAADNGSLRAAAQEACDLLAERRQGSLARSPGHNARLILEGALHASIVSQQEASGEKK